MPKIVCMQWLRSFLSWMPVLLLLASCANNTPQHPDTLSSGSIEISADETFKPVIEEQLRVFDSSFPDAHITIHYKPESECFKDYFENKARMILVTRPLSKTEKDICDQNKIFPSSLELAKDAIAVVTNKDCEDSMLSLSQLKGILTGVYKKPYTVVFDNQGSSTLQFITDSLIPNQKLGSNVFAAKSNPQVVDYVAHKKDAIGFVGLGYVSDSTDPGNTGAFVKYINVAAIQNDSTMQFYQPYQAYIALKLYPLTRKLYYISRESYAGLATGFANFMARDRGQLIFSHAHMLALRKNVVIRPAEINTH